MHARLENKITRSTIFPFYLSSGIALLGEFIRRGFDHFYVRFFSSFFFTIFTLRVDITWDRGKKLEKRRGGEEGKKGYRRTPSTDEDPV